MPNIDTSGVVSCTEACSSLSDVIIIDVVHVTVDVINRDADSGLALRALLLSMFICLVDKTVILKEHTSLLYNCNYTNHKIDQAISNGYYMNTTIIAAAKNNFIFGEIRENNTNILHGLN